MPVVKVRDAIRMVKADGWTQTGQKGSHRQYEHPTKPGKVTIAGNRNDDLPPATWARIQGQAELTKTR